MTATPPLPNRVAGLDVPQDDVSAATWRWAHRSLPDYLLTHSVRAYLWGAAIAAGEGWAFDPQVLWTASLMHDVGLTRIPRNTMCFEVEGAEIARRFLERHGLRVELADQVAIAIILHMQPALTLADGVEAVLLDRATALDVRGEGYALVDDPSRGHGGVPAPCLRPPVRRGDRPGGLQPPGLPERATPRSSGARRLDGAIAMGRP